MGFRFGEPYFPRAHLLHFFNTVAATHTPWITTFEHRLPRWERSDESIDASACRAGLDRILGESCRGLVAFSDASRNVAERDWASRFPSADARAAAAKVRVLLPPQEVIQEPEVRPPGRRPLFAFVGGDFYRKGGLQVLQALHRLHDRGLRDWRLVAVGRLDSFGDYASRTDSSSRDAARNLIGCMADCVVHYERMPGSQVLDLLCRADFYLFPTLADTFGYSALEAMACGAVVVTTNVRAMAEVVDDQTGRSIQLPLDGDRDAHSLPGFERHKGDLVDRLEIVIRESLEAGDEDRLRRARAATARLRARHAPAMHAAAIDSLYRQALGIPGAPAT
jgi:glycosyltransferase involved in cell wall biosynthesis